jgi:hypothetical protein
MAMAISIPRYTIADLERFPDDGNRYELLDGVLLVTPAPAYAHQIIVNRLQLRLTQAVVTTGKGQVVGPGVITVPSKDTTTTGHPSPARPLSHRLEVGRYRRALAGSRGVEPLISHLRSRVQARCVYRPGRERGLARRPVGESGGSITHAWLGDDRARRTPLARARVRGGC